MAAATQEEVIAASDKDDNRRQRSKNPPHFASREEYEAFHLARFKAYAALAEAQGLAPDLIPYACAPAKAGVLVAVRDELDGPWTTLHSDVGQKVIEGEAIGLVTAGPHLVVLRTYLGVAFVDLTREALLAAFAVDAGACLPMAADRDVAIVHHGESLVIMFAGGNITRLPFPHAPDHPDHPPDPSESSSPEGVMNEYILPPAPSADAAASRAPLAITPSSFVVTAGGRRITIARSSVAVGPPGLITLDALSIDPRADARSDDEKCVWLDPARLPPLEPFPTIPSYADLGVSPSARDQRMFSEFPMRPCEDVRVYWDEDDPEYDDAGPGIASFTAAIGLRPSSLLLRFARRQVTDRFFRHATSNVVGTLRPDLEPLWGPRIDPCLFTIFNHDDGCYDAFYDYPPTRAAEHAVVYYNCDDHRVDWIAPSFDGFLAAQLAGWLSSFCAIHVLRVLRMLGLPPAFIDAHPASAPPPWFEAAHPRREGKAYREPGFEEHIQRGDKARASGDLITAERAYVRALHAGPGMKFDEPAQATVAARLADTYAALGWPLHERRMRKV